MENEKVNASTSDRSGDDLFLAFANSFEKNVQSACEADENTDVSQHESTLAVGNRTPVQQFEEPVHIEEAEETEIEAEQAVSQPSAQPVTESEPAPEPTARQIRKAKRQAKKQAKRDRKEVKRNAKIDRQQRNNTKVMLGGAIFLGVICLVLLFMNHFELTFVDIPDVLSGEKSLSAAATTLPLSINEPTESGPTAPPKGNYIVTAEDGVYLRESASSSASRVAVLEEGTKMSVSAFKYDSENEGFWGRVGVDGTYGWVLMSTLTLDTTPTEPATQPTTVESLG